MIDWLIVLLVLLAPSATLALVELVRRREDRRFVAQFAARFAAATREEAAK